MQSVREVAALAKESVADIGASAVSGMEKAKAAAMEKMDWMLADNQTEKDLATERKQERIDEAQLGKLEAFDHNAAAREQTAFASRPGHMTTAGPHSTGTLTSTDKGQHRHLD